MLSSHSAFAQLASLALLVPALAAAQSAIRPGADASSCIQPQHASMVENTPIVLAPCNDAPEQAFFLENGLIRVFSNMCVGMVEGAANGDQLAVLTCDNAAPGQQWTYDEATQAIQNTKTGSCVDLSRGDLSVGAAIGAWTCSSGAANQVWVVGDASPVPAPTDEAPVPPTDQAPPPSTETATLEPLPTEIPTGEPIPIPEPTGTEEVPGPAPTDAPAPPADTHAVMPVQARDRLCLAAEDNTDGAHVVLADCDAANVNQAWTADKFNLRIFGDKCLDVTEGVNEKGTKMQIWTCVDGGSNQLFTSVLKEENSEEQRIQWVNFDKCLDATDGVYKAGQQVQIWQCSKTSKNQNWVIV